MSAGVDDDDDDDDDNDNDVDDADDELFWYDFFAMGCTESGFKTSGGVDADAETCWGTFSWIMFS